MSFVVTLQESKLVFVFFRIFRISSFVFHFDLFLSFLQFLAAASLQPPLTATPTPNQVIDFDSDFDFDSNAGATLETCDWLALFIYLCFCICVSVFQRHKLNFNKNVTATTCGTIFECL